MMPLGHLHAQVQMRLDGIRYLRYQSESQILLMGARSLLPTLLWQD
jgi:hypothetical protein